MDDPIVTLSLWQRSQEVEAVGKKAKQKSNKSKTRNKDTKVDKKPVHDTGASTDTGLKTPQVEEIDSNRMKRTATDAKGLKNEVESRDSDSPSHSDNCFPCLELKIKQGHKPTDIKATTGNEEEHSQSAESEMALDSNILSSSPVPKIESYWLLRLFESNLFNMHIAIHYLYSEKSPNVQKYLGKKLMGFDSQDVDFYLPELVSMFIHLEELTQVLHNYFLYRCRFDVMFSLKLAWLLDSFNHDPWLPESEQQRASRMLYMITHEQIRPPSQLETKSEAGATKQHSLHHRSLSACGPISTMSEKQRGNLVPPKSVVGDCRSGRAFDTGCTCCLSELPPYPGGRPHCICTASRLSAQDTFVRTLGNISLRLLKHRTRSSRTNQLYAELSQLNLNLPARVSVPLLSPKHQILRIPPSEAFVLNSKSKAPYFMAVEILECEDTFLSPLPAKQLDTSMKSSGFNPDEVKAFVHSEGPSPSNTRASSLPNFHGESSPDTASLNSVPIYIIPEDTSETSSEYDRRESNEIEEEEEEVTFQVGDIRRRLTEQFEAPKRTFSRDPEDPSASAMKEPWEVKVNRVKEASPYGHLPNWNLIAVIIKWGDDLRQELMCWQLLEQFKSVWQEENVPLWTRPYMVVVLSSEGGLIEPICNAISLHQIKKECKGSLVNYFKQEFGDMNTEQFLTARKNFVESCAAYCLISYFIQVKDRHNGNILLDSVGHMIHIDFGFILAHSPGKNIRFESSPFKLTQEFVEVMGGADSDMYNYFKLLMLRGFLAARKHMDRFVHIVEIMQTGSQLPCFGHGPTTIKQLRERFHMSLTEEQLELLVNGMIDSSMHSLTTKLYDGFQYLANGIL